MFRFLRDSNFVLQLFKRSRVTPIENLDKSPGADTGILKRRDAEGAKEAPPWLGGATCPKILKVRPPRLAKNALAQCYIKISCIAEIR